MNQADLRVDSIPASSTWPLRQKILLPHLKIDQCRFENDEMKGVFHLGAYSGEILVGVRLGKRLSLFTKL